MSLAKCEQNKQQVTITEVPGQSGFGVIPKQCDGCRAPSYGKAEDPRAILYHRNRVGLCYFLEEKDIIGQIGGLTALGAPQAELDALQQALDLQIKSSEAFLEHLRDYGSRPPEETIQQAMRRHENHR